MKILPKGKKNYVKVYDIIISDKDIVFVLHKGKKVSYKEVVDILPERGKAI